MTLKICELVSIILSAIAAGMFFGPWLALSRSINTFKPDVFLAIVSRLDRNIEPLMKVLMPITLLSLVSVLYFSYNQQMQTFYLTIASFSLFCVALVVTLVVEVPIVKQIITWSVSTLPDNWEQLRDRWGTFHVVRVIAAILGLILIVVGSIL